MGHRVSRGYDHWKDPDVYPKTHMAPQFDPNYGFAEGRKKREMKVTEAEMDRWGLATEERDYCAHMLVELHKCRAENFPLASVYCGQLRHAWESCQVDDSVLRMKEYERERRLLVKERRLKQAQQQQGQHQ